MKELFILDLFATLSEMPARALEKKNAHANVFTRRLSQNPYVICIRVKEWLCHCRRLPFFRGLSSSPRDFLLLFLYSRVICIKYQSSQRAYVHICLRWLPRASFPNRAPTHECTRAQIHTHHVWSSWRSAFPSSCLASRQLLMLHMLHTFPAGGKVRQDRIYMYTCMYVLGWVENCNLPWVPKICNHLPFEDIVVK